MVMFYTILGSRLQVNGASVGSPCKATCSESTTLVVRHLTCVTQAVWSRAGRERARACTMPAPPQGCLSSDPRAAMPGRSCEGERVSEATGGPVFTGLVVQRDLRFRYSFLLIDGWHSYELESDGGAGRIFTPVEGDITTSFSTEARELGTTVTAEDLPILRDGVEAGLRQLPELTIEASEAEAIGDFVTIEYRFTFREAESGALRKRWLRLAYQGQLQVRLIAQGASPEAFDYWLPVFNQAIRTFQFADWWAEVTGQSWQPGLQGDYPTE